jgi:hypothetical protein
MDRRDDGWHYATYIWNADGTEATLAPSAGAASVAIANGINHRIPSEADCRACHGSGPTPVLGFSALQLSGDSDAMLPSLVERGLVRNLPKGRTSPRIDGTPIERAALGYLHGNCGGCHRSDGPLASVGMVLAHSLADPGAAKRTTVGVASRFLAPGVRIAPGAHEDSVLWKRISARTPTEQMPPLGTKIVDADATALIADWIDQLAHEPTQEENRK